MDDFLIRLADCMEVDAIRSQDVLTDFPEWDSLTVLTVLAMIQSKYGVRLTGAMLRGVSTAGELEALTAERLATTLAG